MKTSGRVNFERAVEGDLTVQTTAVLPEGVHPERVTFLQGDACALPSISALGRVSSLWSTALTSSAAYRIHRSSSRPSRVWLPRRVS